MNIFALKKTRASGRNVGKVFNPVVKLVLENQPFLMPEPAEKPSLHWYQFAHNLPAGGSVYFHIYVHYFLHAAITGQRVPGNGTVKFARSPPILNTWK